MARYEIHQTDGNAKRLYAYARQLGMSVAILNRPVDAAVGAYNISALVEVKRPGEKLRPNQQAFLDGWRGAWAIWREEADVDLLRARLALMAASVAVRAAQQTGERTNHQNLTKKTKISIRAEERGVAIGVSSPLRRAVGDK